LLKFKDKEFETYLNIDGEFYKLTNVDRIIIQEANDYLKEGNMRVLVKHA